MKGTLPEHLERIRTQVACGPDAPSYCATYNAADTFDSVGCDNAHDWDAWEEKVKVGIVSLTEREMVFDLVGVDVAFANALRRILIAEVPTMAIEKVYIQSNTSILQDEVLAHRLGLVPIFADPRKFEMKKEKDDQTDATTLVFRLEVTCKKAAQGEGMVNDKVLSGAFQWVPQGKQAKVLAKTPPRPCDDDILLLKLRPGQGVELEAHCEKGIGSTHAKWSPVATASYRLLPTVEFVEPIEGKEAEDLKAKCPMDVFDIEDLGGSLRATAARPRDCTLCRECVREGRWPNKLRLGRMKDHFIFSIESTGALPPQVLFKEALRILKHKCRDLSEYLESAQTKGDEQSD